MNGDKVPQFFPNFGLFCYNYWLVPSLFWFLCGYIFGPFGPLLDWLLPARSRLSLQQFYSMKISILFRPRSAKVTAILIVYCL